MNDPEIIKRCAEAMGISICQETSGPSNGKWFRCDDYDFYDEYDPLHNDAQAMALVKKFNLHPLPDGSGEWKVQGLTGKHQELSISSDWHADLNCAVCECVVRMQETKPSG